MAFFDDITLDGRAVKLCLTPIDWSARPKTTLGFDTEIEEGLSGIESRASRHHAIRVTDVAYRYRLEREKAGEFRDELIALGSVLIAVPLWMDHKAAGEYDANRVFAPHHWVNYEPETGAYSLDVGSGKSRSVGLFVGRVEGTPRIVANASDWDGTTTLRIREDSPYAARVGINTSEMAAWSLLPNWQGPPAEFYESSLTTSQIGAGRERAINHDDGVTRIGQQARFTLNDRVRIRRLLTFFEAKRGSWSPFTIPRWFRPDENPGDETFLQVRFTQDEITLEWPNTDGIDTQISFVQDLVLDGGEPAQHRPSIAHLYKLWWDGSANSFTWTDWEADLVNGDDTYPPQKIAHKAPTENLKPGTSEWEVLLHDFDGNPLRAFALMELERRLHLEIRECDPTNVTNTAALRFKGEVETSKLRGKTHRAKASLLGNRLRRLVPNYYYQRNCNAVLGDDLCGIDLEALKVTGAVDVINDTVIDVDVGSTKAADWFALGYAEFNSGDDVELRFVVRSEPIAGGTRLTIHKPLRNVAVADAVMVYPGCDGQYASGCAKHNNQENFEGFPRIPAFFESADTGFKTKVGK